MPTRKLYQKHRHPRGDKQTIKSAPGRVTSILSIPYGYTVSLWSAGALTVTRTGAPSVLDVMLFVVGTVAAFLVLAGVGHDRLDSEIPMRVPAQVVLNAFPILAALAGAAFPAGMVARSLAYASTGFLATAVYVLSLATLVTIVRRRREQ